MEAGKAIPDRVSRKSPATTARRFRFRDRIARSILYATPLSLARRERARAVWPSRHDRRPETRQRASAVEVARDPSRRGDRGTCSCRHLVSWKGAEMVVARRKGDERVA